MHKLKIGDFVRVLKEDGTEYARIEKLENNTVEATSQTTWETGVYAPETLEYIPPFLIDAESVKKLLRLETTYSAISAGAVPFDNARAAEPVQITLDDLRQAIQTYLSSGMSPEAFADEWYWPLWDILFEDIGLDAAQKDPKASFRSPYDFFTGYEAFAGAWADLNALAHGYEVDLNKTLHDIEIYNTNQDKPLLEREFPAWVKRSFLRTWFRPEAKERADETILALFQRFLNELLAQEDSLALEIKKRIEEAETPSENTPS